VVVLDPTDRVLLIPARDPVRADCPGWWELPGGGLDPGEDPVDAVRRELWEEAGIRDADIGPCVWTQQVSFTFAGLHFDQDEWIHVARCDGTFEGPRGLEALEAIAFGAPQWWPVEDVLGASLRTIPYRMLEFLPAVAAGDHPAEPLDITPADHHVEAWRAGVPLLP
jgi:8-oxo-dGTP pyrophosphatase MutT (NUDIX family)